MLIYNFKFFFEGEYLKGQNELIIGVVIAVIVIAGIAIQLMGSEGKSIIYFEGVCGDSQNSCDGSPPECSECSTEQPAISASWVGGGIRIDYSPMPITKLEKREIEGNWITLVEYPKVDYYIDGDVLPGANYEYRAIKNGFIERGTCQGNPPLCEWQCTAGTESCQKETISNTVSVPDPPETPSNFTAVKGSTPGTINLNWDEVANADYYKIKWHQSSYTLEGEYIVSTNTSVFTVEADPYLETTDDWEHRFEVYACKNTETCSSEAVAYGYPKIQAEISGPTEMLTGQEIVLEGKGLYVNDPPSDESQFAWSVINNTAECEYQESSSNTFTINNCQNSGTISVRLIVNARPTTFPDSAMTAKVITVNESSENTTITITNPPNNTILGTTSYGIQAETTNTEQIQKVDFYVDGELKDTKTNVNPITEKWEPSFVLDSQNYTTSNHSIYTIATDTSNQTYQSNLITFYAMVKPQNLTGVSGNQQVTLNWNKVQDADNYIIGYNTDNSNTYQTIIASQSDNPSTIISGLTNETTYYFAVKSCKGSPQVCGYWTENISVVPSTEATVPLTPENFTYTKGNTPGSFELSWSTTENTDYYEYIWGVMNLDESNTINLNHPTNSYSLQLTLDSQATDSWITRQKISACNSNGCSQPAYIMNSLPKIGAEINSVSNALINTDIVLTAKGQYLTEIDSQPTSYSWNITNNTADCTPTSLPAEKQTTISCTNSGSITLEATITQMPETDYEDTATAQKTITITGESDSSPPTVSIIQPADGSTVSDTITVKAQAVDNESAIKNVKFYVDDVLKSTDSSADTEGNYSFSLNTNEYSNAGHTIKAIAENDFGLTAEEYIVIQINNASSGPECGNSILEAGEDCEIDSHCPSQSKCDYDEQKFGRKTGTCSNCECFEGTWNYESKNSYNYCLRCNSCLDDETGNCNEDCGDTTPPSKPTGLQVIETTENIITIEWNANIESDLRRYSIYYGKNSGSYMNETFADDDETMTAITGLESNTEYFIAITAIDNGGNESSYSNEINAKTKSSQQIIVPAPTGLTAEYKENKIVIEWNHVSPLPDNYILQKKEKEGYYETASTTSNNSFEDTEIEEGKTYYYRIAAFKNGKRSSYSNEIEIKTEGKELNCEQDNECNPDCENDPDCNETNFIPWGIGAAIIVVSAALAYIFFTVDI